MEVVYSYFKNPEKNKIYMYRGSLQDFYWKKRTHESLDIVCPHFNVEGNKIRQYLSNILKGDTQRDAMKEKYIPLVGLLWKVSPKIYYYFNRIIQ